jgi:hypothetical protein
VPLERERLLSVRNFQVGSGSTIYLRTPRNLRPTSADASPLRRISSCCLGNGHGSLFICAFRFHQKLPSERR